jgi:hypothetical protein
MPTPRYPLFSQDAVCENVLLFDGLARAGKGLVGPLVSEFPRLDFAQLVHAADYIPTMWHFGLIDDQSAPAFLRMMIDTYSYQRIIGRNLNTRPGDIFTSVFKALDVDDILARAKGEDGQGPIDRFNAAGRYQSYITHETLPHADLWLRAFPELRIILTVRHPIDICYSWNSRGLGARLGSDPLAFTPVVDIDGEPVPLYALNFPDEYINASPIDRIVMCVLSMLDLYDKGLTEIPDGHKEQVRVVSFEQFATDTNAQLETLAEWLGTTLHPEMATAMAREGVPRQLDQSGRRTRREMLRDHVDEELMAKLLERSSAYETEWSLEPF